MYLHYIDLFHNCKSFFTFFIQKTTSIYEVAFVNIKFF
nr:MAG TPA: hypothetical protein [Caudoviricetes sp.]